MLTAQDSNLEKFQTYINRNITKYAWTNVPATVQMKEALAGFEVLGPIAIPAIPTLTNMIGRGEDAPRAIAALEKIGDEALPALSYALRRDDAKIRVQALAAMIQIGPQNSNFLEEEFLYAFGDTNPTVRCAALALFPVASITSSNMTSRISRHLLDPDFSVRQIATQVVASIKREIAVNPHNRQ